MKKNDIEFNKKNNKYSKNPQKRTIKEVLEGKVPEELIGKINRSFEVVGDIAICEIDENLIDYEQKIGEAIMQINKSIKVVLKKSGIHHGEFRTQDLVHIAGENRKETVYLENNLRLKINPETVYFSARLSTERAELMSDLEENRRVLVMFSGIGPYSFTALKKQPNLGRVTSIEINPEGHKYALENRVLNRNIVKKSKFYKDILEFLRVNKLPIYEKKLIEIVNELKMHFINGDVRVEVEKLKLEECSSSITDTHNELFGQSPSDLFEFLKVAEFKEIRLDLDEIEVNNDLLSLIVLFSQKFDFVCKIESKWYDFKDELRKGYLVNYIEKKVVGSDIVDLMNVPLFDEIYMPLPKDAELFLDCAFKVAAKGAVVHMYDFLHENDFPHLSENAVLKAGKVASRNVEILQTRKVGQYSPRKYRVCCDFKIID